MWLKNENGIPQFLQENVLARFEQLQEEEMIQLARPIHNLDAPK